MCVACAVQACLDLDYRDHHVCDAAVDSSLTRSRHRGRFTPASSGPKVPPGSRGFGWNSVTSNGVSESRTHLV
ncbi:hypothetical protein [Natrinema soli]|uniref:hypothetical protein n=1 Tax=Natrinema soli TaxID=1930624 RepID=UPI003CCDF0E1